MVEYSVQSNMMLYIEEVVGAQQPSGTLLVKFMEAKFFCFLEIIVKVYIALTNANIQSPQHVGWPLSLSHAHTHGCAYINLLKKKALSNF